MTQHLAFLALAFSLFASPIGLQAVVAQTVIDFESYALGAESSYNGSDLAAGFESHNVHFSNEFNSDFGSWSGFAYSNVTDNTTAGWLNQYSAFPGSGNDGSSTYGIGFVSTFSAPGVITIPSSMSVESIAITNSTYAALSMTHGDDFAKKFGGPSGDDPDFLRLDVLGMDDAGNEVGKVEMYLADFRSADPADDFILDSWETVDLSSLGAVASLQFAMETTDVGDFGANTPTYFAFDDLTLNAVPEPSMAPLVLIVLMYGLSLRKANK